MVIGLSGLPGPVASCRIALPLEVTRIVMCVDMPTILPSQEPAIVFIISNAFCASDCGPDVFGAGIFISCGNATAAVATRIIRIRIVSFRIGAPFSSTVSTHKLSIRETNEHDATYQGHDRRLQGAINRCLTRRLPPAIPKPFLISPSQEAQIAR